MHHYGVIMVINSRWETQILTVGPDKLCPARECCVMPSCTDPTLRVRVHCSPLCTAVCTGQAGSWPSVHWLLATQPSQWQSGPGHNNTPVSSFALWTCYEHSLENFGLDKWQAIPGPPGASCQVEADLHPCDCHGKSWFFSFWSQWLDKTLWKCSFQWIMLCYNRHPNWPLWSPSYDLLLFFSQI